MKWGASGLLIACTACTGQSLYTTPRTAPADDAQWTIAPEGQYRTRPWKPAPGPDGASEAIGRSSPAILADVRNGIGSRGEVGLHAGFMGAFGVDGKWNPLRTELFDLALMARMDFSISKSQARDSPTRDDKISGTGFLHLPVLLGLNAGPVTFVASPGGALVIDQHGTTEALRIGLGIQFRLSRNFAVQPEGTYMTDVIGPTDLGVATIGVGIQFSHLPPYGSEEPSR